MPSIIASRSMSASVIVEDTSWISAAIDGVPNPGLSPASSDDRSSNGSRHVDFEVRQKCLAHPPRCPVRKQDNERRKQHVTWMIITRPAESFSLQEQVGRGAHVTCENSKQAELPSGRPRAAAQSLPCLRAQHRWGRTVGREPAHQARQCGSGTPRCLQAPGYVGPSEPLGSQRRAIEEFASPMGLADQRRRGFGRTESTAQSPASASASHQARHACGRFVLRATRSRPSTPSKRKTASRSQRSRSLSHSFVEGRRRPRRFTHCGRNYRDPAAPRPTRLPCP